MISASCFLRAMAGALPFTAPAFFVAQIALCGAALGLVAPTARAAVASWYGEEHRGRPMAWRGRPFDPDRMTYACWCHPLRSVHERKKYLYTDGGPVE